MNNNILKKDIYVGNLKKCLDLANYMKYGDVKYIYGFSTYDGVEIGKLEKYTETIKEDVILIKINDNKYVCIDDMNGIIDDFLLDLGLIMKSYGVYPISDNNEFVCDIRPYYLEELNSKVSVKKLKKSSKK